MEHTNEAISQNRSCGHYMFIRLRKRFHAIILEMFARFIACSHDQSELLKWNQNAIPSVWNNNDDVTKSRSPTKSTWTWKHTQTFETYNGVCSLEASKSCLFLEQQKGHRLTIALDRNSCLLWLLGFLGCDFLPLTFLWHKYHPRWQGTRGTSSGKERR